jgi:hypothetical protein
MVKDQEYKQLEKLYEAERHKTLTLLKQIDDLNTANSQLSMQNSDAKRRLISLDLVSYFIFSIEIEIFIRICDKIYFMIHISSQKNAIN